MGINGKEFARMLDCIYCDPVIPIDDVMEFCRVAKEKEFFLAFPAHTFLPEVKEFLKGSNTIVGAGCSLNSGEDPIELKAYYARLMVDKGADEIDSVMSIPDFFSGRYHNVVNDVRAIRDAIGPDIPLKVILEVPQMTDEQIIKACELVIEGGADYIKTGTGLVGATTVHHVEVISKTVRGRVKIKAAGGIRSIEIIDQMVELGVDRFGVSYKNALALMEQLDQRQA